jgi:predicted amidohydrolase
MQTIVDLNGNGRASLQTGNLIRGGAGLLPEGWEAVCPNPALAPEFRLAASPDGQPLLVARGNGRRECFGYLRTPVELGAGKTYRLRVGLRVAGLDDLNRHLVHGVFGSPPSNFNDGILTYRRKGDYVIGESTFPGPEEAIAAEVRLYYRFSPQGQAYWDYVGLEEWEPIPPRPVRVACSWGTGDLAYWSRWLDAAGERRADLALLPEMFNGKNPDAPEPIDGPSATLLADKARQWRMYTSASFYERRDDLVYNTAPLFDRSGGLAGTYSKNELFDPELEQGVSPGTGYPVFRTDFGTVGIIICYDSWFPEPTRLLAYQGAELVLFPNAGFDVEIMPARASDNGVWIAVSSLNGPAGVWDSGGTRAGELIAEPTRHATSTVRAFERDDNLRLLIATVDLSRRYSPHYWGGPLRSAPGGRRVRQTLIEPIEPEIARQATRWWMES